MQLEKKNQRDAARKQKETERRTKASLALKLREVEPPDDLEIELAALRDKWLAVNGPLPEGEDPPFIERPPFPPPDVTDRLMPAFTGTLSCLVAFSCFRELPSLLLILAVVEGYCWLMNIQHNSYPASIDLLMCRCSGREFV